MPENQPPEMFIEYMDLQTLIQMMVRENPKDHDLQTLEQSMTRFGYVMPLMIDEQTNKIGAGHGRLLKLRDLYRRDPKSPPERIKAQDGHWFVPVIREISFTNYDELMAYLVADNRITEIGGWSDDLLAEILGEIFEVQGAAGLEGTGFTDQEVKDLLNIAEADQDTTPEETLYDRVVQIKPQQEYVVISCESAEDWEHLKMLLGLRMVPRGGYPSRSPFYRESTQRVITAPAFFDIVEGLARGLPETEEDPDASV